MSTTTSSSSDEEESVNKRQNSFIVKKPHFLRRARTLPYELRLLKQRQDGRRRELEKRQQDDISDHISVIEMELSVLNQLLDEDVEKTIREELSSNYNILTRRPAVPILNEIYSEPSMPSLGLSVEQVGEYDSMPECENSPQAVLSYENGRSCPVSLPSTSADSSTSWQHSREQHSPFTDTEETSTDIELFQEIDSDSESDDDVIIVEQVDHRKTAYQRYRDMLRLWNSRVTQIKDALRHKYRAQQTNITLSRIQNFKNLVNCIREIKQLLRTPNVMRNEEHYAQLQARVSITKFMEFGDLGQFDYLDEKRILILRQADKELAEFQYEWCKSKMNSHAR